MDGSWVRIVADSGHPTFGTTLSDETADRYPDSRC